MKKFILPGILLIIGSLFLVFWLNRTVSVLTLDINPSIQIELKNNGKVKKVKALNDDAKAVISGISRKDSLSEVIDKINDQAIFNGYIDPEGTTILISGTGKVNAVEIGTKIQENLNGKHFDAQILVIDNITEEDKELANKYKITPAKAAYIKSLQADNEDLKIESLVDKSVNELHEMKDTGNYCDEGYTLEGDRCAKEIDRKEAETGEVCPQDYVEYEGKCHYSVGVIDSDELVCGGDLKLSSDNKCVGKVSVEATPNFTCEVGNAIKRSQVRYRLVRDGGNQDDYLCEDTSSAEHPTERCYKQEHAIINGKCAMGPKPLLPTPTGCEGHDINYNGGCYDPEPEEPYSCPDGMRYDDPNVLCEDTIKYTKASGYYSCNEGYTLNGSKCEKGVTEEAHYKKACVSGYTLFEDRWCIDKAKTTEYVQGNVCKMENSRLVGNTCIIYEYVDAKHN